MHLTILYLTLALCYARLTCAGPAPLFSALSLHPPPEPRDAPASVPTPLIDHYNGSCNFASAMEVANISSTQHINITAIIQACPLTCSQAYGYGNPDLAGVGASSNLTI